MNGYRGVYGGQRQRRYILKMGLPTPLVLVLSNSASVSVRTSRPLMFGLRRRPDLRSKDGPPSLLACILDL